MENISGMQIASALMMLTFFFILLPRARHWMKNSPEAGQGDWKAFAIPLLGVVLFVALLMYLV